MTRSNRRARFGLAVVCALSGPLALAGEVIIPLRLSPPILENLLAERLGARADGSVEVVREAACRFLELDFFSLSVVEGGLRLEAPASLAWGPDAFGRCVKVVEWHGRIELSLTPWLDMDHHLRYRLTDTVLVGPGGEREGVLGVAGKVVQRILHPRIESFDYDIAPPRKEISEVLMEFVPEERVDEIDAIFETLRTPEVVVGEEQVVVPLHFSFPEHYLARVPRGTGGERVLAPEEIEAFANNSQAWDAFLVHVIKTLGLDIRDAGIRMQLLDLLLTNRYHIAAILEGEAVVDVHDPVRELFVEAWESLRAIVEDAGQRGLVEGRLLTYLSFLSAGDALLLFDRSAPGLGIEISADGLRRLARALGAGGDIDPLHFGWEVDPILQELFEPGAPPPAVPPADVPQPAPERHSSWMERLMALVVKEARAGEVPETDALAAHAEQLGQRLDHWLPDAAEEMDSYRTLVGTLLKTTATLELARVEVTKAERRLFPVLLSATALIESCWRQYQPGKDGLTWLRSPAGAVGLMQINPRVWRGFFDIERLKTDVDYNILAGTRILLRYFMTDARKVAKRTGKQEDAIRAAYAAYNAGPKGADRFLRDTNAEARAVDARLWKAYGGMRDGGVVNLMRCVVEKPASRS